MVSPEGCLSVEWHGTYSPLAGGSAKNVVFLVFWGKWLLGVFLKRLAWILAHWWGVLVILAQGGKAEAAHGDANGLKGCVSPFPETQDF